MLQKFNGRLVLAAGVAIVVAIALMWLVSRDVELEPVSPLGVATARPTPTGPDQIVVVTWDQYVTRVYTSEVDMDDPNWEPSFEIPDWRLYADVELRKGDQVVRSRTMDTGHTPPSKAGEGIFAVITWNWDRQVWGLPPEPFEEWLRVRWSAPGEEDVVTIFELDDGSNAPQDERGFTYRRLVGGRGHKIYFPILHR